MYRERNEALARGTEGTQVFQRFVATRDDLFASHPQSALDPTQRGTFHGLSYFPYSAGACLEARIVPRTDPNPIHAQTSQDGGMPLELAAVLEFELLGYAATLPMYWIDVYGGGLLVPFRDETSNEQTYGGGRYLVDTVKGSDFNSLDADEGRVTLDFNYAYNPSCAYNPRWSCPLAPAGNCLPIPITAGELRYEATEA
jgi:uncharacterized protein